MKKLAGLVFILSAFAGMAQVEVEGKLDLLQGPNSPAANLLGISESEIQQPGNVTDLMANLRESTDDFTLIPSSFALDFAPFWIFGGEKKRFSVPQKSAERLNMQATQNRWWQDLKQTTVLSIATNTLENDLGGMDTRLATGLRFSLLRGNRLDDESERYLQTLQMMLQARATEILMSVENDEEIETISSQLTARKAALFQMGIGSEEMGNDPEIQLLNERLEKRTKEVKGEVLAASQTFQKLENHTISYTGFKLDLNGAMSWNYPNQVFDEAVWLRSGAWLTAGYQTQKGFSALVLGRYLYNTGELVLDTGGNSFLAELQTYDFGARLIYQTERFLVSGEGVFRSRVPQEGMFLENAYRFTINAQYTLKTNQLLTFSFGRDYDGATTQQGTLIAALNLVMGFGNRRKFGL